MTSPYASQPDWPAEEPECEHGVPLADHCQECEDEELDEDE